ncbi:TonB-dependent receptor [Lutibacter sp. A64]|uniref:TonB-dependent receptor n=1 Tax=Lutibacter sp. A64 TaxID=2918526 RepID=UPI001F056D58|nr:TonB-dependent receptor [Lutibacter sp. A64]UMB52653.1 TonB-dependent receptor [Lutibacter sp. A64]
MKKIIIILINIVFIGQTIFAQDSNKSASITGKTTSNGAEIPYVSIFLKGTTIGTTTNENAEFNIINLKPGFYTIQIQSIGFKPFEQNIELENNENKHINIELEPDVLGLEEVVVTGNRSRIMRKKASTIVNVINAEIFQSTQSATLSEGLNFCSGLRMENDCQNCGFSQVRMNGLEGPYSQILINSRPIFSGLAGVYGLELIPSNMIEKVEIIRGGGSALYGSNAIAGTINLLLKDPTQDAYEIGITDSFIGVGGNGDNTATDYTLNFNATVVGEDDKNGVSIYGFHRNRKPYDDNNDSFSEIASLNNTTLGSRMFQKLGTRAKVSLDFFHINEKRRGGNKFDLPNHEADISEAVEHHLTTAAVTFEQYYRENDLLSIFASSQKINRDSYYGAEQSLSDYGNTKDFTFNTGVQYNAKFKNSELVSGIENTYSALKDKKLGYVEYSISNLGDLVETHYNNTIVSDQKMNTLGLFSQYDIRLNKFKLSLGARFDTYKVEDKEKQADDKTGNVFSPRVNLLYDIQPNFQARLSYSAGYRAPQIFDEDLHIETSGSRKVIHENASDLEQETSDSFMLSFDYSKIFENNSNLGILIEGFYTKLNNPFVNEFSDPSADGVVTYLRVNADEGATVSGVNFELNYVPNADLKLKAGYTFQTSEYEEAQEFNEKSFFRTPDSYGFFTADWELTDTWCVIGTGTFTGKMLVPYFGADLANPEDGELRESDTFFDAGLKITKTIKLAHNNLEISGGIKNIFNSFQEDFDTGIDRDPAYIYGPMTPRTIYFGLKFGNILN